MDESQYSGYSYKSGHSRSSRRHRDRRDRHRSKSQDSSSRGDKSVETMTTKKLLVETLNQLSPEDFDKFKSLIGEEEGVPVIWRSRLKAANTEDVVELMVEMYSRECVEATTKVLMKMSRTDLVQRLSGIHPGTKEEVCPPLVQRAETMASVIELLLETLEDLSDEELKEFRNLLWFLKPHLHLGLKWMEATDHQDTVFLTVQLYGQESVLETKEALEKMKRMDLVQKLSDSSSGFKKKLSVDERRSALIQKVAAVAAVKHLLWETLNYLSFQELKKFRRFLQSISSQKNLPDISSMWSPLSYRTKIADVMVEQFGQQSVEVTREVFRCMNRTDLMQKLPEISSGQKEKHSVAEPAGASREAAVASVRQILWKTLKHFTSKELNKFKLLLQFTHFQKNLPEIPQDQLLYTYTTYKLTDLMEDMWGEQSVEVTREVLKDMNRTDLVQKLSEFSSEPQEEVCPPLVQRQEVLMTSVTEKLKETLEYLNDAELNHFKWILQKTVRQRGLPRILSSRMERADRADVVELMVAMYNEQSVDMTREVFRKMNRTDLVQKLPEISSASKGDSRSLELEGCGSVVQDSSVWTKLEPEVNNADADQDPTYSLQSEAGHFECRVSGLRWVCKENAIFKYHFCSWGGHMERMERRQYMPAGALMDISVIAGKLNEVYLPHWICIEDNPKILDQFAVLHIDECGDVVEKASEVTASHVKLPEPIFSRRAVLMKLGFPVKIKCNVLMYYKPKTRFLKLHVYVIPLDPALQQKVDKEESSSGYEKIVKKPQPDKYLQMQQGFTLKADIDTAEIQPEEITLRYDDQDPNFYEVYIGNPDREFNMTLHPYSNKTEAVWTCKIRKDDHPNSGPVDEVAAAESSTGSCSDAAVGAAGSLSGATGVSAVADEKHSVDEQLSAQLHKAATISSDRERIQKMLEHLKESELKEFKWTLEDSNFMFMLDLPCIQRCKLDKADMLDLVDLMIQAYSQRSVEVTKKVFKKMNRNDLVLMLSDSSS